MKRAIDLMALDLLLMESRAFGYKSPATPTGSLSTGRSSDTHGLELVDLRRRVGGLRGYENVDAHEPGGHGCTGCVSVDRGSVGAALHDGRATRPVRSHLDVEVATVPSRGISTGAGVGDDEALDRVGGAAVDLP